MDISYREPEDAEELTRRIQSAKKAKQRDRLRAVQLAIDGVKTTEIASMLGRSRRFVQQWSYTYRDHGLDAVAPTPQPGRPPKLPPEQYEAFKQRVLAGPTEDDEVCALRGRDMVGILEEEFGAHYTLSGVYELLKRLGLSVQSPRPEHWKADPEAMNQWVERAPFLSEASSKSTPTRKSPSGSRMKHGSDNKER